MYLFTLLNIMCNAMLVLQSKNRFLQQKNTITQIFWKKFWLADWFGFSIYIVVFGCASVLLAAKKDVQRLFWSFWTMI